jgi:hypothetical protein
MPCAAWTWKWPANIPGLRTRACIQRSIFCSMSAPMDWRRTRHTISAPAFATRSRWRSKGATGVCSRRQSR